METTMRISLEEFLSTLDEFTGTVGYYLHKLANGMTMHLTDGCQFVREFAGGGAYWLFDAILSHQVRLTSFRFQVWKLIRQPDKSWLLLCTDGNEKCLATQRIPHSDFPIDKLEIWYIEGIALLPSEY